MMQPNPVLRKLGFSDHDRVVILHADDIGLCQSSVAAFDDLWDAGVITSGAVMVPCPWALEAARLARRRPDADLGVHLTLNSEHQSYRWGPLSSRDPSTGMLDKSGFFHAGVEAFQDQADPEAVALEIQAQVEWAFHHGIVPTHIDTHMGAVAHLKFIPAYIQVAAQHHLPPMIFRMDEAGWQAAGFDIGTAQLITQMTEMMEEEGLPLLDHLVGMPLNKPLDRMGQVQQALSDLQPGITHFIVHPAKDTPELRAITSDWPSRVADYQTFCDDSLQAFLRQQGIHAIGYRAIKALIQG